MRKKMSKKSHETGVFLRKITKLQKLKNHFNIIGKLIFFKNFFNFKLRFLTNGVTQKGRVCACLKAHSMFFKKRAVL